MAEAQLQLRALTAGEVLISQTTEALLLSLEALKKCSAQGQRLQSMLAIMLLFIPHPARTSVTMLTEVRQHAE